LSLRTGLRQVNATASANSWVERRHIHTNIPPKRLPTIIIATSFIIFFVFFFFCLYFTDIPQPRYPGG